MGKSLIQVANQSTQTVSANSIISLGSVQRRYGCNLKLSGNAVEVNGEGYYKVDVSISVAPTEAGNVTVALYSNGVQLPGAIAYSYSTTTNPTNLTICSTIRLGCCCDTTNNLTLVLSEGAGEVQNVSMRVEKS